MKKQILILILPLLFPFSSISQDFKISPLKLEFNDNQLLINYDIINENPADIFFVWVEMEKKNGDILKIKSISGDVGDKIKSGNNKRIKWIPERDSVFLNEEVVVEVKAEKYVKTFNKGSMVLLSTAFPGWGQTKISKGKPWWLTGVVAYGTLASGLIIHSIYLKTYNSYSIESDPVKRADLLALSQSQNNISSTLIISGVTIWAANILWVAFTPNRYQPMQHIKISLEPSTGPFKGVTLLALKFNF